MSSSLLNQLPTLNQDPPDPPQPHVNNGLAQENAFTEYDAIQREVSLLRQLVEKIIGADTWDRVREEDDFAVWR